MTIRQVSNARSATGFRFEALSDSSGSASTSRFGLPAFPYYASRRAGRPLIARGFGLSADRRGTSGTQATPGTRARRLGDNASSSEYVLGVQQSKISGKPFLELVLKLDAPLHVLAIVKLKLAQIESYQATGLPKPWEHDPADQSPYWKVHGLSELPGRIAPALR